MDGPARPPRMCSACTQCHAAKVRCTGERSGCARCRQIGAECVYKISLVGRTSKHGSSRNQRPLSTSGSNSPRAGSGGSGGSAVAGARRISASGTSSPVAQPRPTKRPPSSSQARVETIHVAAAYGAEEPQHQNQHQHQAQHQHEHQHNQDLSPSSFLDHQVHDLMMDEGALENMSQEFIFDWDMDPAPAVPSATGRRNYGTDTAECSDSATVFGGSSAEEGLFTGPTSVLLESVPAINAAVASATAAAAAAMSEPVGEGILTRRLAQPRQNPQHHSLPFGEPSPKLTVGTAATITTADPHNLARLVSLAEIVRVLEASVNSKKHHTPDAIMKTNKACMAELTGLFGCEKPLEECQSCCLLITSALDLILTLFEGISESLSALSNAKFGHGQGRGSDRSTASGGATTGSVARPIPPVQFGVFELDPDEQLAMTKRILHSELRRYQHIANGFSASVTAAVPSHIQIILDEWWEGMKKRLCRLLSAMAV